MRKSRFNRDQRKAVVDRYFSGEKVDAICRDIKVSPATFYKWKSEFEDDADEDKRRLKDLEKENARLKKMLTELSIDHDILKEGYAYLKKVKARENKRR